MTGFAVPAVTIKFAPPDLPLRRSLPDLTVLVPCFQETSSTLIACLRDFDPTDYKGDASVWLVVEADAEGDRRAALSAAKDTKGRASLCVVPSCRPKARGLNTAIGRVRTPLVAVFDADCRLTTATLVRLVEVLCALDLDIVEALDISISQQRRAAAANAQAIAFQASMEWVSLVLGRRFMGSSSIVARRSLFESLGLYPEDGVEEGYRWSLVAPSVQVRHGFVPLPVAGDVPDSVALMLRQRTRWATGQIAATVEAFRPGAKAHRLLALVGGASLALELAWSTMGVLALFRRRVRPAFAVLTCLEYVRLRRPLTKCDLHRFGISSAPMLGLALEFVEGLAVVRAVSRFATGRSGLWDDARANRRVNPKASRPSVPPRTARSHSTERGPQCR